MYTYYISVLAPNRACRSSSTNTSKIADTCNHRSSRMFIEVEAVLAHLLQG